MKLIIASANLGVIKEAFEYYPVSGVATNPTVLAAESGNPIEILSGVRSFIGMGSDLHVQVVGTSFEGMVAEAERIVEALGDSTLVKVPVTKVGLKAIRELSSRGYRVTATAIYTPAQGYLAGLAGAEYAAPYVGRTESMGFDGIKVASDMVTIFRGAGIGCKVFAASCKSVRQIVELARAGVQACTPELALIEKMTSLEEVDAAVETFSRDFGSSFGQGMTMADF